MARHITRTPVNRELTGQERDLLTWLLTHGKPGADRHLPQVDKVRVVGGCDCGCASIDFVEQPDAGLEILADYQWHDDDAHLFAGLEVWSVDGDGTVAGA